MSLLSALWVKNCRDLFVIKEIAKCSSYFYSLQKDVEVYNESNNMRTRHARLK